MTKGNWQKLSSGSYELAGDLTRDTVPGLWDDLQTLTFEQSSLTISLSGVLRVDSSGMVMLIHLLEHAKKQNCHIMLSFVPQQLMTLAALSSAEELFLGHI
ncbi:STAS domain-containing protein [Vibrio caribbeanicus]|uniref:Putative anti-sigma B factor antagonist n=1 Tax=Vibrio caribbeanicus ATCC BAA-2122 TaxID=796620 RepID=E3BG83_9VIBR|nr:STAS domain-containing protein [Vibrio caribbeanicus]EFP97949.1 putative anti-sigma B factor antagonist [Vibrio caribbeanicus ATCC BAA-2122]